MTGFILMKAKPPNLPRGPDGRRLTQRLISILSLDGSPRTTRGLILDELSDLPVACSRQTDAQTRVGSRRHAERRRLISGMGSQIVEQVLRGQARFDPRFRLGARVADR